MARPELIDQVRVALAKAGFAVSERCEVRPISFDVVARRDARLLILKVLGNVDAFTDRVAQELHTLARMLHGTALLVGQRSGAGDLEDGVMYQHRGVPVMTVSTLEDLFLENTPPFAYATPGGINVQLNGTLLRRLREERSLSLGMLAQVAGVSRRAIQMYEEGMRATVDAALRLEEFLQSNLIHPIDPFRLYNAAPSAPAEPRPDARPNRIEVQIFEMLRSVGFEVVPTHQSPFDAVSRKESDTILTGVDPEPGAATRRRAQLLSSISSVTEKDGMIVIRRQIEATHIQGTPVVNQDELERMRDPKELADLLDERRPRRPPVT